MNKPKMLSIREVAHDTNINLSEHTLRLMVKQNLIPGTVFVGKKCLINVARLEEWLAKEEMIQVAGK